MKRAPHAALVRVEELYPWPGNQAAQIVDLYPAIEEVVWAQEEPKNQGAWSYAEVHKKEQERIIAEVNAPMPQPAGTKSRGVAVRT